MKNIQSSVGSKNVRFPLPGPISEAIMRGLIGLMDVDGGPTPEQSRLFNALANHVLGIDMGSRPKS